MAQVEYIESTTLYFSCNECGFEMSLIPGRYRGRNRTTGCCGSTSEANLVDGHYEVKSTIHEETQDVDFIMVRNIKFVDNLGALQTTTAPRKGHSKNFTHQTYDPPMDHTCTITTRDDGTIGFSEWKTTVHKEEEE